MQPLQLDSFLSYRFLSSLQASPNKKKAAYVLHSSNLEENCYRSVLYTVDPLTRQSRQLTAMEKEKQFFWLDDDTIVFPSLRKAADQAAVDGGDVLTVLYKISISGGEATEYLRLPYAVETLAFLEDGDFLFTAAYHPSTEELRGMRSEEKKQALQRLQEDQDYQVLDEIPFWSNGGGFTNKKRARFYRWDAKTQEASALTDESTHVESFFYERGKALLITTSFTDKMPLTNALLLYDVRKNHLSTLVEDGLLAIASARFWGETIFFTATAMRQYGINENPVLYLYQDGAYETFLAPDLSLHNSVGSDCRLGSGQSFDSDGATLYLTSTEGCCSFIKRLDKEGELSTLTKPLGSIDALAWCLEGMLFIGLRGQKLQELYLLKDGEEIQLTSFNETIQERFTLSTPRPFPFSSRGQLLDGFVLEPVNYDPTKTYPGILDIHGGPKTVYGTVFYHEIQLWANKGYFVFFCNPQGSDGRGNAFADIRREYGFLDYQDLMAFTDAVLAHYPQLDPNRLGVTGGSYGGFMTNWIIGQTTRFACAASQRSIANWISKFGTTDIGYYFVPDQQGSTPWSDAENLWLHSPMRYANQVKTPTLFIHSEEDYRCWLTEGLQMFTSLKYHGVPSRLCLFRGENHELSRSGKPKHRVRRLQELTQWFEQYLKGK